jgi:hypothetical protein
MKFGKKSLSIFNSLINNVYFLYLVAFVSLIDVIGYIIRHQYSAVVFFYLVGMLTFYYTKNMSVVLLTALVGTTLMHFINNLFGIREGMNNKEIDEAKARAKAKAKDKDDDANDEAKARAKAKAKDKDDDANDDDNDDALEDILENMNNKKSKNMSKKQGYQNNMKLKPSLYNMPNKDQVAKQLGKADKMEKAYDNLEKIVGNKGIQSMNESTRDLIKQQDRLLKGLKDITPSINNAMESIGKIDFTKLGGMFGSDE